MSNDPGTGTGSKSPDEIREEIEETRAELGDTVEALGAKTDVKGQARAKVDDAKGEARAKVEEVKENLQQKAGDLGGQAKEASPEDAVSGAQAVVAKVRENPAPAALAGALLLGYLLGRRRGR